MTVRTQFLFAPGLALAVWVLPASASAQLFQPGTQPANTDGGLAVAIQPSRSCNECHGGYDSTGDYEPYDSWRGSMMASSARDPVARAAMAIAEADDPVAHDFCVRCHTPSAWLGGRSSLPEYATTNPAYPQRLFPDMRPILSHDLDGVGCMVCHRMTAPADPSLLANAQLFVDDGPNALRRRGPYGYGPPGADAGVDPMHPTFQDSFESSSGFCGSCHDIQNPVRMGHRGSTATGRPFAIERTYTEWLNSAFGGTARNCQSCHMTVVTGAAANTGPVRTDLARHDLVGGSVWAPLAVADAVRDVSPATATLLEASSIRAQQLLRSAARVEVRASALAGGAATATVRVTNTTGHKLPTGYPEGRRMWLEVAVLDATGRVVAGSGLYDDATATLATDAQLRTYEARLGEGSRASFHFMQVDTLLVDTRIPPEGFRTPDATDMAPLGRDYGDGAGGYHNWDEASYSFADLCGEGTLTLRARVRYQSNTREYMEFLRDTAPPSTDPALASSSWGQVAYRAWMTHGGDRPVDMVEASAALGPSPRACPQVDAGPPDAGHVDPGVDAGRADTGVRDAGPIGSTSSGCGCRAMARRPGSIAWLLLAAAWLARRARRS